MATMKSQYNDPSSESECSLFEKNSPVSPTFLGNRPGTNLESPVSALPRKKLKLML